MSSVRRFNKQNYEKINENIKQKFLNVLEKPDRTKKKLNLSWSNWGFGQEKLEVSIKRLVKNKIKFIELHGNRYGNDLGYDVNEVKRIIKNEGIKVAGICGMFSIENDLSSVNGMFRQNALDYIKRNLDIGKKLETEYMLIVPGAVGRAKPYDLYEVNRSVDTLRRVAHLFVEADIKAAIEPIRSAEVSFCHTFEDAENYIKAISHPGVKYINGDIYHMLVEENHIADAILKHGDRLINLHMADTNRGALGQGMMDLDTILMALYIIGYNNGGCFCTPEPLGPGGDPYPAMHGIQEEKILDKLVKDTAEYFFSREETILTMGR